MTDRRNAAPGGALRRLAALLTARNVLDREMTKIIGKPMEKGNFGEFVAAQIFDIRLNEKATEKGYDGRFTVGEYSGAPLKDRKVEIKYYAKCNHDLDLKTGEAKPAFYLVMTGPPKRDNEAKDTPAPWVIESVFLFETEALERVVVPKTNPVGIKKERWAEAQIYPAHNGDFTNEGQEFVNDERRAALALFGSEAVD